MVIILCRNTCSKLIGVKLINGQIFPLSGYNNQQKDNDLPCNFSDSITYDSNRSGR